MVACWDMDDSERANSIDCGQQRIPRDLAFYFFNIESPTEDMEGDIDSFVMRAAELGIPCTGSTMQAFNLTRPVSQMFAEYFHNAGGSGRTYRDRYRCFVESIGGTITGSKISNRADLLRRYQPQVESFAETFYLKIMKDARGFSGPGTEARIIAHGDSIIRMQKHSAGALNFFFDYLDAHL